MSDVRSPSEQRPADRPADVDAVRLALGGYRLLERARLLGVADESVVLGGPDDVAEQVGLVAGRLGREGVGRAAATVSAGAPHDPEAVERLLEAIDASPLPEREWAPLRSLLGDELLARLVGVSHSSLGRYAGGARPTPDLVAARLHVLAMVCADLRGGYNDYGIRRWFVRPRPSLEAASVADVLGPHWDPDGPAAELMRTMAMSVLSVGAT
jgi:hypothetical protein